MINTTDGVITANIDFTLTSALRKRLISNIVQHLLSFLKLFGKVVLY